MSIPRLFRKISQSLSLILQFLNQLSSLIGSHVAYAMNDFVKTSLISPISDYIPLYAWANDFVTSLLCPSKFSKNCNHRACWNCCFTYGKPLRKLTPFGLEFTITSMVRKLQFTMSLFDRIIEYSKDGNKI